MNVSIIIKALNEEANIARAIASSLRAVDEIGGGEVILADSLSTDRTIEIAIQFPIRIVQLAHGEDRCCGVGAQLGYEIAHGEFVYILDGDMEFEPGFLRAAIDFMVANPAVAGVGGQVREMVTTNEEFRRRATKIEPHMRPGPVDRLNMGGLYRHTALAQSGHFTNRNLHAWEEFELSARLHAAGWTLVRLDIPAVRHYGHAASSYRLLLRRWQSKHMCGYGEVIRQAWGQPHFSFVLRRMDDLKLFAVVAIWWFTLMATWMLPIAIAHKTMVFIALLVLPLVAMAIRKRRLGAAFYSVMALNLGTLGLLRGIMLPPKGPPNAKLRSTVLK